MGCAAASHQLLHERHISQALPLHKQVWYLAHLLAGQHGHLLAGQHGSTTITG
jgi:UDP-N-acetylmuramate-alanine ligase